MPASRAFLTVVSGLPRSGTSMMMRILEAGGVPALTDNVRQSNEDNPGGYYEFEPVKQTKRDPSWLQGTDGKAVKMVYRLLYDLPTDRSYRVVFMRREIEEVLRSQRIMLQRDQRVDEVEDREMAALFRADVARCDKWLERQPHITNLNVDYQKVVTDPRPTLTKIADYSGRRSRFVGDVRRRGPEPVSQPSRVPTRRDLDRAEVIASRRISSHYASRQRIRCLPNSTSSRFAARSTPDISLLAKSLFQSRFFSLLRLEEIEKVVRHSPSLAIGHLARGMLLQHVGQADAAIVAFEQCVTLDENSVAGMVCNCATEI